MNIFQADQLSKSYGEKLLFDGISFSLSQGDKAALIARNGAGKTTLLKVIAGADQPDSGACTYKSGLKIAFLEQEPHFEPGIRVSQALLNADNEVSATVREYEEFIAGENAHSANYQHKLQQLIERMDALEAWDFEHRIKQILTQLKINDLKAMVETLSGGQQKRLALARILIDDADFILLDEPTNHLDLDMVEWLEAYLARRKQTLLVVTHDRYFLDAVCNAIIELDQGKLYPCRGNYTRFLEKKQERLQNQEAMAGKAENLLRKEAEWMRRSPQARTTKSKARVESFYELEKQASLNREEQTEAIRMEMVRMGKKILELTGVSKQYDGQNIIGNFSYVFKKGERVGVAGPNGSGKSTLLNIITGSVKPDKGSVISGETIQFGYYRQEGLQADDEKRVIDVIKDIAESISLDGKSTMSASQLLHQFNFPHKVQNDRVGKLSGGEKRRLYLITVLMKNPNFLILDEPTNDFDIDTLNILEAFLSGYPGCLVIVSHDRYFLDRLVDHLFVFEGNGIIRDFTGNYTAYRLKSNEAAPSRKMPVKAQPSQASASRSSQKKKLSYKEQQEYESLESDIEALESERNAITQSMSSGNLSQDELLEASARFKTLEAELEKKSDRWLELSEMF